MIPRQYFTYKASYEEDNIHLTSPHDIILDSGEPFITTFVCQIGMEKLCYTEPTPQNISQIKTELINRGLESKYTFLYKTTEEAKVFIDTCFGNSLISSEIVGDTVNFEIKQPEYL